MNKLTKIINKIKLKLYRRRIEKQNDKMYAKCDVCKKQFGANITEIGLLCEDCYNDHYRF
jgi:protein-arginine kinase activator protein McsA